MNRESVGVRAILVGDRRCGRTRRTGPRRQRGRCVPTPPASSAATAARPRASCPARARALTTRSPALGGRCYPCCASYGPADGRCACVRSSSLRTTRPLRRRSTRSSSIGWNVRRDWRLVEREWSVSDARVVCCGVVATFDDVSAALLAAVRGAGVVARDRARRRAGAPPARGAELARARSRSARASTATSPSSRSSRSSSAACSAAGSRWPTPRRSCTSPGERRSAGSPTCARRSTSRRLARQC